MPPTPMLTKTRYIDQPLVHEYKCGHTVENHGCLYPPDHIAREYAKYYANSNTVRYNTTCNMCDMTTKPYIVRVVKGILYKELKGYQEDPKSSVRRRPAQNKITVKLWCKKADGTTHTFTASAEPIYGKAKPWLLTVDKNSVIKDDRSNYLDFKQHLSDYEAKWNERPPEISNEEGFSRFPELDESEMWENFGKYLDYDGGVI